jgi:hypothetical protein
MKIGLRMPTLTKRVAARTSPARWVRQSLGVKAPRGWGWLTHPRRAAHNRVNHRTSFGLKGCGWLLFIPVVLGLWWTW